MSDPFVGEIQAFPFAFAIAGFNQTWLPCFGQMLAPQSYSPLYALIGTSYGGNGTTNFALPNLNGAVTISQGAGPGLQPRVVGEQIGSTGVTLGSAEMAQHTHRLQLGIKTSANASPAPGTSASMTAIDPAFGGFVPPPATLVLAPNAIALAGQGQAHNNMQPTQALVWCI